MNPIIKKIIQFVVFLSSGVFILWLVYKDQDPKRLLDIIKHNVDYSWIGLSMVFGLASHFSRTMRWQMLIEPVEKKTRLINTFFAVMVGYFANLILPRMGEISRCGVLAKYEKVSFTRLVGTVVVERLIDVVMLLLCLLLVLVVQFNMVIEFLGNNTDTSRIVKWCTSPVTYVVLFSVVAIFYMFRSKLASFSIFIKVKGLWSKFSEGFLAIKAIENKLLFVFHTLFIWVMYFLMIYVCFFSFDFTSHLGPMAGLAVFVMGSLGMVAPVQGGIGPWHFMVIATLHIYLIPEESAKVFALVVHGALNLMILLTGIISTIALPIVNRKPKA